MTIGENVASDLERARLSSSQTYSSMVDQLLKAGDFLELIAVSKDEGQQAHYVACRLDGMEHSLAEMFALGRPPMSNTDREFLAGHCNGNQFENTPYMGDYYQRIALRSGVDPKGKVYISGLARFPGDPTAWVGGKGEIKKLCEQRGWGADGLVKNKIRVEEPSGGGLASDIIEDKVDRFMDTVPDGDKPSVNVNDVREKIVSQYKPSWAKTV